IEALMDANYSNISTQTINDPDKNYLYTTSVEVIIKNDLDVNRNATIVIKSTIPFGYTKSINDTFQTDQIIFSPDFLREGQALHDNLYPSRIVVGEQSERARIFTNLLA